jgi:soluble lytic murein transglycosylase
LQAAKLLHRGGEWHEARRFVCTSPRTWEARTNWARSPISGWNGASPTSPSTSPRPRHPAGIILPRAYFPLTGLEAGRAAGPADLVMAIARRESEFDPAVVSPADARGLLQVLPGTGELVARRLGIDYHPSRLTTDPEFNALLGAAYLDGLIREFGALPLVAAGYNAGPGRPRRWVQELGDPRDPSVDPVDWVESIPFAETRNYVMRVLESLVIYRAMLNGDREIRLTEMLRGN